jgi:quercetin dioxygenase-like cupin family protein
MTALPSLAEALPMPDGQRASLPLLDLKDDTKVVLVAIPAGGQIPAHQVPYPASVLLLSGSIEMMLGEEWTKLAPGTALAIGTGMPHAIRAGAPSYFIVTHLRGLGARTTAPA